MEIAQERSHLRFGEPALEGWHLVLAEQNQTAHFGICRGNPARQLRLMHRAVDIWRRRFEAKIVVLMAMGAANFVKMLALLLLRCKRICRVATG